MKNPFSSRDISEPTRRRVELAIAVAQERLLSTHVDHALKLIQLVGEHVPFENALGIYVRMLRLSDDEARVITTRALAILGEQAVVQPENGWTEMNSDVPEVEEDGTRRSFLRNMRQRLRGRVKDDLRRWVELSAARTEVAILNTHVENALNFIDLLEKEQQPSEAVEVYLDALEVRESVGEVAYYIALSRVADRELPEAPRSGAAGRQAPRAQVVEGD